MKKPIIGIVGRISFNESHTELMSVFDTYRKAVIACGGNPIIILPPQNISYYSQKSYKETPKMTEEEENMLLDQISMCDGILSSGGYRMFNYDRFILEYAYKNNIPTLGICLGMQIMCHEFQNTSNMKQEEYKNHKQEDGTLCHDVMINKDSKLYKIVGKEKIKVNSLHLHSVSSSGIFDPVATSTDGLIEAVEAKDKTFYLGVQWHPEKLIDIDESARKILTEFINCCKK